MTHNDDAIITLRPRIQQLAESCRARPLPVDELIALAGRSPRRHRTAVRGCLAAVAAVASTLLVGNIATATATPATIPARPIPAAPTPAIPGSFAPVAALQPDGSDLARTLWLASDPSGLSQGCVSLTAASSPPPSRLPNVPREANVPSTTCAYAQGAAGDASLGYLISLESGPVIAYGFVPAAAVRVELSMSKTGLVLFRLANPTTTVTADVYGADLGLPIRAWSGPDLSGFRVTAIKAFDSTDRVVAELSFGQ